MRKRTSAEINKIIGVTDRLDHTKAWEKAQKRIKKELSKKTKDKP